METNKKSIDGFELGKTIGEGGTCKVKLCSDNKNNNYAIKVMNTRNDADLAQVEYNVLNSIKHKNVVNAIQFGAEGTLSSSGKAKKVAYLVLELCQQELFDAVCNTGAFSEPVARYFFQQLLDGLNHVHQSGYAHRDLKPENLFLSDDYTLKIADFGFAAPVDGRDNSGYLKTQLGTRNYMAPEIIYGKPYTGPSVDLFAAAIIAFVMISQRNPFGQAEPKTDSYYAQLIGNPGTFWSAHEKLGTNYSSEFKDLFENIMTLNPTQRLNMVQVQNHPWLKGPTPTYSEIQTEFDERSHSNNKFDSSEQNSRQQARQKEKNERRVTRGTGKDQALMNLFNDYCIAEQFVEDQQPRETTDFDMNDKRYTKFFSTSTPNDIFMTLVTILYKQKNNFDYEMSCKKWKCKIIHRANFTSQIKFKVTLQEVNQNKLCVDFKRLSGDQQQFSSIYETLAEQLKHHNDTKL